MASRAVLVTGGAGFIGSRLVPALVAAGDRVCVLDSLHPQVHGPDAVPPAFPPSVTFARGDVRDTELLARLVRELSPEVVFHLAAETGTGQSYDRIAHYCDVNVTGTAQLIEALRAGAGHVLARLVLTSSRAVYGEGPYRRGDGTIVMATPRRPEDLAAGRYDVTEPGATVPLVPVAARAGLGLAPASIYGSTKLMQEFIVRQAAFGARWRPVILRLQNVYGPGQSLRNPYTGVLSVFCAQALAGKRLNLFEDGRMVRDFVYVDDVVRALCEASSLQREPSDILDIGSGQAATLEEVAQRLLEVLGASGRYDVSGDFRPGDVRHALADTAAAERELDWRPQVTLAEGLARLAAWSRANEGEGDSHDR